MACTVAVESVIGEHYNKSVERCRLITFAQNLSSQLRDLMEHADQVKDKDLIEVRNVNGKKNVNE